MPRTARPPGVVLGLGLACVIAAALAPAGLGGGTVPAAAWLAWGGALALALAGFARAGVGVPAALRRTLRYAWASPLP